jgi:hypothetical protein
VTLSVTKNGCNGGKRGSMGAIAISLKQLKLQKGVNGGNVLERGSKLGLPLDYRKILTQEIMRRA